MNNIMGKKTITMLEEKCNTMRERKGGNRTQYCVPALLGVQNFTKLDNYGVQRWGETPHNMLFSSSYIEPH